MPTTNPRRLRLAQIVLSREGPDAARIHNDGFRTGCTSSVLHKLGITGFRLSQTAKDVVRIASRNGFKVASRRSALVSRGRKGTSVARLPIHKMNRRALFLVQVPGHVLLLRGEDKAVLADTDPRPSGDRRRVINIWEINR